MAACDPKDEVDRLFACFKCGVSPPRKLLVRKNGDFPPDVSHFSESIRSDSMVLESAFRERPPRERKKLRVATAAESSGGGSSSSSPAPDAAEKVSERPCFFGFAKSQATEIFLKTSHFLWQLNFS